MKSVRPYYSASHYSKTARLICFNNFTERRYASAVFAVVLCSSVCLSVHLSVTSRYCVETTRRTELVFGMEAFRLPYTALRGGCLQK